MEGQTSTLGMKLRSLRNELRLTQKEFAAKASITESAYRAYELGDRNPKPAILNKIAKAMDVQPEFLSVPGFKNWQEFVYALLENEDRFGYSICCLDGKVVIAANDDPGKSYLSKFFQDWNEMRKKVDSSEITYKEYVEWMRNWANSGE